MSNWIELIGSYYFLIIDHHRMMLHELLSPRALALLVLLLFISLLEACGSHWPNHVWSSWHSSATVLPYAILFAGKLYITQSLDYFRYAVLHLISREESAPDFADVSSFYILGFCRLLHVGPLAYGGPSPSLCLTYHLPPAKLCSTLGLYNTQGYCNGHYEFSDVAVDTYLAQIQFLPPFLCASDYTEYNVRSPAICL